MSSLYSAKVYSKSPSKILPWKKKNMKCGYHVSNGIQIKISDFHYILITTDHSIPYNSKKIFSFSNLKNGKECLNKLVLKQRSGISDLALLEYGTIRKTIKKINYNDISELKFLTLKKFSKKIPKPNSQFNIILSNEIELYFTFDKLGLQSVNGSNDIPPTPVLSCSLTRELMNINLNGLSGSPVYFKKKIVGIISNFDRKQEKINLVPSFIILRLIQDYVNKFNFRGSIQSDICMQEKKINFIKVDTIQTKNGLLLNSDYSNKIRKNYLITRIDHKILDENGCVYSQEIKHRIPWNTYIMTLFRGNKISITFKDKTNFNTKLSIKDCNKYMNIDNNFKSDFCIIKGFVFCELNLPLINYFFKRKILLDGPSIRKINNNNINNYGDKEIVLIDYVGKSKDDIFKGGVTKIFDNEDFTSQSILTLKKYNSIRIKDLHHLNEILKIPTKNYCLHLEYNQKECNKILKVEF